MKEPGSRKRIYYYSPPAWTLRFACGVVDHVGHMSIPFACIPMHSSTTMHRPEITKHNAQSQVGRSRYSCRRAGSSGSRVAIPFGVANTGLCCGCIKRLAGVAHTFASVRIENGDILARSRNAESGVPADGAGVG